MMSYYKRLWQIALPAVGEQLLQMAMGLVDNLLLAQLGLVVLSGVALSNQIMVVYQSLFLALSAAIGSLVARHQKNPERQQALFSEVVSLTVGLGVVLGGLAVFTGRSLLEMMGAEDAVLEMGATYLSLVGGACLFMGLMTSLGAYLRAKGRYRLPVMVSLLANILNAILSALAVFVFQWGLVGVALATVLSRLLGVLVLWSQLDMPLAQVRCHLSPCSDLVKLALPASLERLMMRLGDVVVLSLVVRLGTRVLAGAAVGESLAQFIYLSGFALATAIVLLTAEVATDLTQVKRLLEQAYLVMLVPMWLVAIGLFLGRSYLVGLFSGDQVVFGVATLELALSLVGIPATAGTLSLTAVWQGLGNAKLPFYATSLGMWLIRVVLGYLLAFPLGLGMAGLYLATILDNSFRALFLYGSLSGKLARDKDI